MKPVKLYSDSEPLTCAHCEKDLFEAPQESIVVFIESMGMKEISNIYACCKGECDDKLKNTNQSSGYVDGWKDLTDFMNPILYVKHTMAMLNRMHDETKLSDNAIKEYKNVLLSAAPYVMRQPTEEESNNAAIDSMFSF